MKKIMFGLKLNENSMGPLYFAQILEVLYYILF